MTITRKRLLDHPKRFNMCIGDQSNHVRIPLMRGGGLIDLLSVVTQLTL